MNQKQKKAVIIISAIVIIIAIVAIVVAFTGKDKEEYVKVEEDGTRINTSEKMAETKQHKGLEFTNIKFTYSGSITNLRADVRNTTENDMPAQSVNIKVVDKSGNVITTFSGSLDPIRAGESTVLSTAILANYTNAYNIEFVD